LSLRSFFFNHTGVTSIHYQAVFVLVLDTGWIISSSFVSVYNILTTLGCLLFNIDFRNIYKVLQKLLSYMNLVIWEFNKIYNESYELNWEKEHH
jgi:hypothetical protein